ncbi:hypothetical protein WMY93_000296 [Mugilogobius chulae]|uniref:Uncharacterized protein n=1 Tax=Mugilogobius chulae TaxID=88201 RepID=A0AAW0Q759_9GOBI
MAAKNCLFELEEILSSIPALFEADHLDFSSLNEETELTKCCEMSELEICKKAIRDLEEKLRQKATENDLLRATNRDLTAANILLKSENSLLRGDKVSDTEERDVKAGQCEMETKTIMETNIHIEEAERLKCTNEKIAATKAHLRTEIESLYETLETQIDEQEQTQRLQKEAAEAEIIRLKSENEDLQKRMSESKSEILIMFEELEDKLATELKTNHNNAETIAKLQHQISHLEIELRIQTDKNKVCAKENAAFSKAQREILLIHEEVEDKLAAQVEINCNNKEEISRQKLELLQTQTSLGGEIKFLNATVEKQKNTIKDLKVKARIQKELDNAKLQKVKTAYERLQDNLCNIEKQIMAGQEELEEKLAFQMQKSGDYAEEIAHLKSELVQAQTSHQNEIDVLNKVVEKKQNTIQELKEKMKFRKSKTAQRSRS